MENGFLNSVLIHIGTNLWYEENNTACPGGKLWQSPASGSMRFDLDVFHEYTERLRAVGVNALVLDLADGIIYESHPELAIEGSLTREELVREIERLTEMGFELIPKLNFSTCHDVWMKDYSRMVGTAIYYDVCRDLIKEVCEVFKPRFLHLGMDEENYENQRLYNHVVIRQNDAWWEDLRFLVECTEACGARAMIWTDYARHRPDEFVEKCPRSVVGCSWYYFNVFEGDAMDEFHKIRLTPFTALDAAGFDQLAGASNEYCAESYPMLKEYCEKTLSKERFLGMIETTWLATVRENKEKLFEVADIIGETLKSNIQ